MQGKDSISFGSIR